MIDPMTWRQRHPRCEFCKYYKLAVPAGLAMADFFECIVKKKTITFSKLPRPFCPCYDAKVVNFERK